MYTHTYTHSCMHIQSCVVNVCACLGCCLWMQAGCSTWVEDGGWHQLSVLAFSLVFICRFLASCPGSFHLVCYRWCWRCRLEAPCPPLCGSWGSELKPSQLHGKSSTHWAILQPYCILLSHMVGGGNRSRPKPRPDLHPGSFSNLPQQSIH